MCAQNKYKSVETKTFCNNIKIANETEQKTVAEGEREGKGGQQSSGMRVHSLPRPLTGPGWRLLATVLLFV